ncbi:unnamed protein product [Camellia sinensis]
MESCRPCKSCGKRTIVSDDATCSLVCASCGIIQEFDDLQHHFGGLSGPTGTFVRTGTAGTGNVYHYKETKLYRAKETLERITSLLDFWPSKTNEVRVMVETITEGEYGQGDWLPVLIGACAYVVMRNDNKPLPLSEVADKVSCDIFELGRMVNRVVDFLELKLPEFNIVNSFQWVVKTCFDENLMDKEKIERILKQGIFLMQCLVKWYLTTGRRPIPVVVAVLVFVAQLNEVDVQLEDIAKELHVAVRTCKLRYKELLNRLVKVAQALPWGKDINVKNIIKNAGFVIQYMELKSMSKHGEKRKSLEHAGFDLDGLVRDCLSKEVEFGMDSHGMENDSLYFEVEDPSGSPRWSIDDLEKLKISYECLSLLYSELSNEVSDANLVGRSGSDNRRKRGMEFDVLECREWWKGKSELSKKLFLKQILEKDVGLNALPPSFVSGCLAYQRRREKIKAAKVRIDKIMCPPNANSSDRDDDLCILECVIGGNKRRRKKIAIDVDWEDFIIETLLLHRVEEEEIEKGHYNTLLGLHVFNSGISQCEELENSLLFLFHQGVCGMDPLRSIQIGHDETLQPLKKGDKRCTWRQQMPPTKSICTKFGWSKRKKYNWNKKVGANIENQLLRMDFMEGVAPELSPQQNKIVNLTTHESSMIGVDIDPKKGLCNKNSLAHQYLEKPFPTEIPVVVDTAEKDSSLASSFCGVNKSDDERWDGQEDLSTPVSLDGYHSCMKEDETTNHVNATADKSNVQPSANSVILGSCNCRVSDTVLTSGDAFSAISNDSVGLGLSYPIKFLKQKIICFHSRFWTLVLSNWHTEKALASEKNKLQVLKSGPQARYIELLEPWLPWLQWCCSSGCDCNCDCYVFMTLGYTLGHIGCSSRGPTFIRGSDWNPSGGILHIAPNELSQVVEGYTPLASCLGVLARDGNLMPLTYRTWSYVLKENKERIWREVKVNTNARESMKKIILASVGKKWREWKCRVKKIGYKPFNNDTDRLTYRPEGVHDISGGTWSIIGALGRHSALDAAVASLISGCFYGYW